MGLPTRPKQTMLTFARHEPSWPPFPHRRLFCRSPAGPEETTSTLALAAPAELTSVQMDERRAAHFYEFAIPFEVATAPASRESTGSIMNRSDDGRIIDLNRSWTGGVARPEPEPEVTTSSPARLPPRAPSRTSGADWQAPVGIVWCVAAVSAWI